MHELFRWAGAAMGAMMLSAPIVRAQPGDLPRKAGSTAESYRGVVVLYDSISDPAGHRLRLIVTHPQDASTRAPVIFVVGWLSCDSVEAPPGTTDATQLVLQSIAKLSGFATVRMDKAGVGDSEGDCAATDFTAELAAYRQAFRKLKNYSFVDSDRIFIFGISNGGGFAPLVAETAQVKGYVVDGGWIKTWYEHMLEIERRRLTLAGHGASELNTLMKRVEEFYSGYLLDRLPPREILARRPEFKSLWEGDPEHQYGRPVAYYQQLQDLNLMAAWSGVKAPLLALHGEFDWIMSRGDLEIMVGLVNHNVPGAAEMVELPATGHTFEHYVSPEAAFAGKLLPFDDRVAGRIGQWFERHR
ncbi:MAG TPA: alpha/beta hydrolase [Steroidobacteraceae bacterium]|nr:alpha/beta hydrolase [Steroidobacteraceae bacterium]